MPEADTKQSTDSHDGDSRSDEASQSQEHQAPGREDDGQEYLDRSKLDFDPDDGLYSGTAVDGNSEIPGPHEADGYSESGDEVQLGEGAEAEPEGRHEADGEGADSEDAGKHRAADTAGDAT